MVITRSAWLWVNGGKALLLLLAVVLLSRLPFLSAGYGLHWDSWGNAKIAETGHYTDFTLACGLLLLSTLFVVKNRAGPPFFQLAEYLKGGFTIYYLPAIRQFEYDVHGIDLAKYGAIDVHAFHEAQKARIAK